MPIAVDSSLCRGCEACMLACALVHEGLSNPLLGRVQVFKDMAHYTFEIRLCRQCDDPACVPACPANAILVDRRGIPAIQEADCLQCGLCAEACPYQALFHDAAADRYFKCDLCPQLPSGPACVNICPVEALTIQGATARVEV